MPITGLVAHLSDDPALRAEALESLRAHPRVTVGPIEGARAALVTETERAEDDPVLFESLGALPGVLLVSVVFHDFSDVGGIEGTVPRRFGKGTR